MVDKKNVANIFPLTPLQEGMLYREHASGAGAYTMQSRLRVNGDLDAHGFEEAWNLLVERHEPLRMLIVAEGAVRPLQVVLRRLRVTIPVHDISGDSEHEQERVVEACCSGEMESGFDLKCPRLYRLALFKLSSRSHILVMTFHHIIMDGWCQGILNDELIECYRAVRERRRPSLPQSPLFSRYVRYLESVDGASEVSYWREVMEGYEPGGETSWMKREQSRADRFEMRRCAFSLSATAAARIRTLAAECGTTMNTAFQTLWGVMLCNLSGKRDCAWGTVVSGRPSELPGSDRTIGLFINTVPVRFRMNDTLTFRDALVSMSGFLRASMNHHHVPLAEVQRACGAREGLFDHLLVFENYPVSPGVEHAGNTLSMTPERPLEGHTDYDLVCVVDAGDAIECCLKYNAAVVGDEDVFTLRDAFIALAEKAAADPDIPLDAVSILPPGVLREVTRILPRGETLDSDGLSFPALFAAGVRKHPDRTAVEARDGVLTYAELDAASDAIAAALADEAGVNPGDRIALMTGRDRWMISGILGIMKASAVFVPLDPGYPDERIRFIIEDCGCRTVVVSGENARRFAEYAHITVVGAEAAAAKPENVHRISGPAAINPPYVIYTSGSTGQPKGVMVGHGALANFIRGYTWSVLDRHEGPLRIAFVANYVFDAAGRAFYPSLCRGDTVYVVDEETRLDGAALLRFLADGCIDILDGTPSLCALALEGGERPVSLRRIVLGGESLKRSLVEKIHAVYPRTAITNVYGPTETTIDSTFHHVGDAGEETCDIMPIGSPLPNQRAYVLDDRLRPLPVGAAGEIYIGGVGLAEGYLGREDLTRERFVPDPFMPGEVMYRTGDGGRWGRDGNLHYTGRRDSQVKVRGFRVEIGEVESALSAVPGVGRCAVVPKTGQDGALSLCAFYEGALSLQDVRGRMRLTLPSHMIPDLFIEVNAMPLTPTGKIDRRALAGLADSRAAATMRRIPPVTPTECQVVEAMGRVLGRDDVSMEDGFFDIGGHSLLAARLITVLAAATGKRLPISAVYRFPQPKELAVFVERYDPALAEYHDEFRFHFNESPKVLYCFPPYGAVGIVYGSLARVLEEWRLECFNYLADGDFVRDAVREILHEARKSPVTFLGYSGGGNLAFEAARAVETGGGRVGRLILLDSYRRLEAVDVPMQRHEQEMREALNSDALSVYLPDAVSRERAIRNGALYAAHLSSGIDSGVVDARIDLVCADDANPDPARDRLGALRSRRGWGELTRSLFRSFSGHGSHDVMLDEANSELNGAIIRTILNDE